MKKKTIPILVMMLMIATTASPVLGSSVQHDGQDEYNTLGNLDVTLDVAITTDWVNGWQDHGLRIKEFALNGTVYAYSEISSDDLFGLYFQQRWHYNSGTGLEFKWEWAWTIGEHWSSAASWSWWQIGLDYGKGVGIIETLVDNVSLGYSNWFAIDNTQPNKPTIEGPVEGEIRTEYEYKFTGIDPDGFDISYFVEWGDGTDSGWTDYVASGTEVALKHTWDEEGTFVIRCKVKDLVDSESDWEVLEISMPKTYEKTLWSLIEKLFDWFEQMFGRAILTI